MVELLLMLPGTLNAVLFAKAAAKEKFATGAEGAPGEKLVGTLLKKIEQDIVRSAIAKDKQRIDGRNPDIAYVCAMGREWGPNEERGVFRTSDGGKNWQKVLYRDTSTGCSNGSGCNRLIR